MRDATNKAVRMQQKGGREFAREIQHIIYLVYIYIYILYVSLYIYLSIPWYISARTQKKRHVTGGDDIGKLKAATHL